MELIANQINILPFVIVDTNDDELAGLGTTFSVAVSKNGGAFAAGAGTKAETGDGWYSYAATAAECAPGSLAVKITAAGARQQNLVFSVAGGAAGAIEFPYTLTDDVTAAPIVGASVRVTTDTAGLHQVASGVTNAFGIVTFYLQAGTYQFWRASPDYTFVNPDEEVVG